jgi:hypothetical protein
MLRPAELAGFGSVRGDRSQVPGGPRWSQRAGLVLSVSVHCSRFIVHRPSSTVHHPPSTLLTRIEIRIETTAGTGGLWTQTREDKRLRGVRVASAAQGGERRQDSSVLYSTAFPAVSFLALQILQIGWESQRQVLIILGDHSWNICNQKMGFSAIKVYNVVGFRSSTSLGRVPSCGRSRAGTCRATTCKSSSHHDLTTEAQFVTELLKLDAVQPSQRP